MTAQFWKCEVGNAIKDPSEDDKEKLAIWI